MRRFVAYYRVSTARQGESGLGLEAQASAVSQHVRSAGGVVFASFTETESGKRSDRPELARAIAACKRVRATLVIAKLDRLARNLAFVANLMESGVDFVACDNPTANRLTIHILAAVAEDEARRISERTTAALAAARQRGTLLGGANPAIREAATAALERGRSKACERSAAIRAERAKGNAAQVVECIKEWTGGTIPSLRQCAALLNEKGVPASRGGLWFPASVRQVLMRAEARE